MFLQVGVGIMAIIGLKDDRPVSKELLRVGDIAPDFSVTFADGKVFRLGDFRGKKNVVLFFYPKNFTPGCTKEVCGFRDNYAVLKKHDAEVVGVSCDVDESHRQFSVRYDLPYTLIPDTTQEIAKAYGAAGRLGGLLPGAKRVTYVIDTSGIVRGVFHHEVLVGRHIGESIELLKKLAEG